MAGLITSRRPPQAIVVNSLPPVATPVPNTAPVTNTDTTGILSRKAKPVKPTVTQPVQPAAATQAPKVGVGTYTPVLLNDPNQWNITPEQTVQGQIKNIVAEDSPLMQQAETAGLQQANARGLLNSGMAIGNAREAVYKTALPIATSDADVYARSAGYNADESNKFAMQNQNVQNQASEFGAGNKFTAQENAANRALQTSLQASQNEFLGGQNAADRALMVQQDQFKANVDASLAEINNSAKFDLQTQAIAGTLSQDFSRGILAINQDVNMNQQTKDYAIEQLYGTYKGQLSLISAVGSIPDVSTLLNFNNEPAGPTLADVKGWFNANPGATDSQIVQMMKGSGVSVSMVAQATGLSVDQVQQRFTAAGG